MTALGAGPSEHVVIAEEVALVGGAFRALPERWRSVLWLTEVEGLPARDVAAVLGMSANAVAQLSMRARAGLRRNYLQAHVGNGVSRQCKYTVDRLGAYVAGALARREIIKVERHLDGCEICAARLADLEDVGSTLRRFAVVPIPLALGGAAAIKWRGAYAGRLASSAMSKALSAATVAVLGLGLGAIFAGPHRTHSTPALASPAPASASQHHTVTLATADPPGAEATETAVRARGAATPTPAAGQSAPGADALTPPIPSTLPPSTPKPTSPTPPTPDAQQAPVVQTSLSGSLGVTGVGAAAGVGPGSCTTVAVLPSSSECALDRASAGVTVAVGSALLSAPLTVSLP